MKKMIVVGVLFALLVSLFFAGGLSFSFELGMNYVGIKHIFLWIRML